MRRYVLLHGALWLFFSLLCLIGCWLGFLAMRLLPPAVWSLDPPQDWRLYLPAAWWLGGALFFLGLGMAGIFGLCYKVTYRQRLGTEEPWLRGQAAEHRASGYYHFAPRPVYRHVRVPWLMRALFLGPDQDSAKIVWSPPPDQNPERETHPGGPPGRPVTGQPTHQYEE